MSFEFLSCCMIGTFLLSLVYPWHPKWPGARWSLHLPLLQLPLWIWYEFTNSYDIRVDIPILVLGFLVSAIVYVSKVALFLRIRVSELEGPEPHAEYPGG